MISNEDNMELMARYPNNYFDLAIVDPPYRDAENNKPTQTMRRLSIKNKQMQNFGQAPTKSYFDELIRVSKNQIIWGANYFPEIWQYNINKLNKGCKGFIYWHKNNPVDNFSDGELAWTSFDKVAKCFNFSYYGSIQGKARIDTKIHPTQKPVQLYEWLLMNYAKEGDKILDTHLGSGSIAIACYNLRFELTACELNENYYKAAIKRLEQHKAQQRLF